VEVGGVVFVSCAACKAWIKIEAPADITYCFFSDPHAFLNVGDSGASNSIKSLSLSVAAVKAGFSLSEKALVMSSFKFELPTFFGKDSSKGLVKTSGHAYGRGVGFKGWLHWSLL
jgi:hypothetical protein